LSPPRELGARLDFAWILLVTRAELSGSAFGGEARAQLDLIAHGLRAGDAHD
jgi:hypothetical protein